jgi:hypothetical protein
MIITEYELKKYTRAIKEYSINEIDIIIKTIQNNPLNMTQADIIFSLEVIKKNIKNKKVTKNGNIIN